MKRKVILIALLALLIMPVNLIHTDSVTAYFTSNDIRAADQYSDPDDYQIIIMDSDRWELRMNILRKRTDLIYYYGTLVFRYGNRVSTGELRGIYDVKRGVLLVSAVDERWNGAVISYTLQDFDDNTYRGKNFELSGLYCYLDRTISNRIGADVVKGSLG